MKKLLSAVLPLIILPCLLSAEQTIFLVDGIEATATLSDSTDNDESAFQRTGRYSVRRMTDNDPSTCWAAGNGGVGVKIYILAAPGAGRIGIINGLAKNRALFLANNRVKKFIAVLYAGYTSSGHLTEIGRNYVVTPWPVSKTIVLGDTMSEQSLKFPFDWNEVSSLMDRVKKDAETWAASQREPAELEGTMTLVYILSLEIKELYRGNKYNDTCISELSIR